MNKFLGIFGFGFAIYSSIAFSMNNCGPDNHLAYSNCLVTEANYFEDSTQVQLNLQLTDCQDHASLNLVHIEILNPVRLNENDRNSYNKIWKNSLKGIAKKAQAAKEKNRRVYFQAQRSEKNGCKIAPYMSAKTISLAHANLTK